jgi:hypothetical protein
MKKIENVGNLPNHLQVFDKELQGQLSTAQDTEFYEIKTIEEFEKNAPEVGYEIVPTIDESTGRGFLVGFDVTEPKRIATLLDYSTLMIYFTECSDIEIKSWINKMKEHRQEQQTEMFIRREKAQNVMRSKNKLNKVEDSND